MRKNAAASAVLLSVDVGSAVAVVMMMKGAAWSVGADVSLEIGSADCRPLDTAAAVVDSSQEAPVASPYPRSLDPIDI